MQAKSISYKDSTAKRWMKSALLFDTYAFSRVFTLINLIPSLFSMDLVRVKKDGKD